MSITSNPDVAERFHATPVKAAYRPDNGPGRYRIGLIVLSNDYVTERDFMNMRPSNEVAVFASRVPNRSACTVESLREMTPHITTASALLVPDGRLDAIAYSCTSGTVVMGFDAIQARIHAARPRFLASRPLPPRCRL